MIVGAPAPGAAASPHPLLLSHLRDALSCLFSLPRYSPAGVDPATRASHEQNAHAFLLDFRGRNVRRKRKSVEQSRRDNANAASTGSAGSSSSASGVDLDAVGSAWLAAAVLLSLPDAHDAERLFAAQTMLHRLRRFKLAEAVDSEIEDPALAAEVSGEVTRARYCEVVCSGRHALVHRMLGEYCATASASNGGQMEEEKVKGELALLNVAALLHISASSTSADGGSDNNVGPVLSALGSALAVAALRFKFCGSSDASANANGAIFSDAGPALVNIVTHSASTTSDAALALNPHMDPVIQSAITARVVCSCLASLPDALLGSPGGARGRLSIDPRCLQAACTELRDPIRGLGPFRDALSAAAASSYRSLAEEEEAHARVLQACDRWAKFVPLPVDFVEGTVPVAARYMSSSGPHPQSSSSSSSAAARSAAYAYLIALFDGATLTHEAVLAMAVGLSPEAADATHQSGRRKQSSKSKKRHKERLHAAVHEDDAAEVRRRAADAEVRCRGDVACRAAALVWEGNGGLREAVEEALEQGGEAACDGEGPVGCVCSCAAACLPHLLKRRDDGARADTDGREVAAFFASVMGVLRMVCCHPERSVRALASGPLAAVHAALETSGAHGAALGSVAVDGIYECSMALAASCGYPPGYLDDLSLDNDDDLENERDDVRNVLRSVTDLDRLGNDLSAMESSASMLVLRRVLGACSEAVAIKNDGNGGNSASPTIVLPPETAVHALSALAKPLNRLGATAVSGVGGTPATEEVLVVALRCLGDVASALLRAFASPSPSIAAETFAVSRITCLATTSYAPLFASIVSSSSSSSSSYSAAAPSPSICSECCRALSLLIGAALASASALPELAFASSLDDGASMFDIRGAMRGPGGEDHVGCIAVNRLSVESERLARTMLELELPPSSPGGVGGGNGNVSGGGRQNAALLGDLCRLHDELKASELARGPGVHHGAGVAPASRRIVLGTISRLSLLALDGGGNGAVATSPEAADGVRAKLHELFRGPVEIVVVAASTSSSSSGAGAGGMSDAEKFFRICEAAFDLSAFSTEVASELFSPGGHARDPSMREGARGVVEAVVGGYSLLSTTSGSIPDATCIQWGRLRAAAFALIEACANPGLTSLAAEAVAAVNQAECEAIVAQCNAGRESNSSIFQDSVVGDDVLSAGAFVVVVRQVLDKVLAAARAREYTEEHLRDDSLGCVQALSGSMSSVFAALASRSPEAEAHVDPRPTLAEAWYLSVKSLASLFKASAQTMLNSETTKVLMVESFVLSLRLLLSRGVEEGGRKSMYTAGMSLDGPQTFAILDFMELLLSFGPEILELTPQYLQREITIDAPQLSQAGASSFPPTLVGGAIIAAALFRGSSGVLPPWAVEGYPSLFSSFFIACGRNTDFFCQVLSLACDLQLAGADSFGELQPGHKLAGRFIHNLSLPARNTFLSQSREVCSKDNETSWRRFKVIVKQACGGKKKASGFNQKPAVTTWECDRV